MPLLAWFVRDLASTYLSLESLVSNITYLADHADLIRVPVPHSEDDAQPTGNERAARAVVEPPYTLMPVVAAVPATKAATNSRICATDGRPTLPSFHMALWPLGTSMMVRRAWVAPSLSPR